MKFLKISLVILLILMLGGCGQAEKKTTEANLTISAAMSMKDALTEIKENYQKKEPDVKLTINFGASGTLRQQIEQGAPVDLFISADSKNMDQLEDKNIIAKDSRQNILGNKLVVVSGKDLKLNTLADLKSSAISKIAIGTPEFVPAGKYAKEALTKQELWQKVVSKIVFTKDVRQVIAYIDSGNAEAGFAYLTDTKAINGVNILNVPEGSYKPIVYPAAIIAKSTNQDKSKNLLQYLTTPEASKVFEKYGFVPLSKGK